MLVTIGKVNTCFLEGVVGDRRGPSGVSCPLKPVLVASSSFSERAKLIGRLWRAKGAGGVMFGVSGPPLGCRCWRNLLAS